MINLPNGKRSRGRPKKSLDEVIREDLKVVGLMEDLLRIGDYGGIELES